MCLQCHNGAQAKYDDDIVLPRFGAVWCYDNRVVQAAASVLCVLGVVAFFAAISLPWPWWTALAAGVTTALSACTATFLADVPQPPQNVVVRSRTRVARRLERKTGWKPRQGVRHPKGRNDTHNRFLIEAVSNADHISLALREWYYAGRRGWCRTGIHGQADFSPDAVEEIGNYRAHLNELREKLESERAQQRLAAHARNTELEQQEQQRREQRQQEAQRALENRQFARQLSE
jgi:hypothetical protein